MVIRTFSAPGHSDGEVAANPEGNVATPNEGLRTAGGLNGDTREGNPPVGQMPINGNGQEDTGGLHSGDGDNLTPGPTTEITAPPDTPTPTESQDPNSSEKPFAFVVIGLSLIILVLVGVIVFFGKFRKNKSGKTITKGNGLQAENEESFETNTVSDSQIFDRQDDESFVTADTDDQHCIETETLPDMIKATGACSRASREGQTDSFFISEQNNEEVFKRGIIACVSEGIRMLPDGNIAARTIAQTIGDGFRQIKPGMPSDILLLSCTGMAQKRVLKLNETLNHTTGATLAAVYITPQKELSFLSVGNSRIYLVRNGAVLPLNRVHLGYYKMDELEYVYEELPSQDQKRNILLSYIGQEQLKHLDRNVNPIMLLKGDRIVLMTGNGDMMYEKGRLKSVLADENGNDAEYVIEKMEEDISEAGPAVAIVILEVDS